MDGYDDDLGRFLAYGAPALPAPDAQGFVDHDGARIWHATWGAGPPVVLLHGGLGHSGNWGHQVPALLAAGYRVVAIDSRGHGRSTRDARPFSYAPMAADVAAVLDALGIERTSVVGWSDGAAIALILALRAPARVGAVFYFACNMDPSGARELGPLPETAARCLRRHALDYARLSATPDDFKTFSAAVSRMMATEPDYGAAELARIAAPVTIAHAEHDEFIRREHSEYLARTIPGAELVVLPGVSHFAPLQRPEEFNTAVLDFLRRRASGARGR